MATKPTDIQAVRNRCIQPHPVPSQVARQYRAAELANSLGVSVSTLWRWNAQGRIPKARQLSPGVTVWDGEEIDAWLASHKSA